MKEKKMYMAIVTKSVLDLNIVNILYILKIKGINHYTPVAVLRLNFHSEIFLFIQDLVLRGFTVGPINE